MPSKLIVALDFDDQTKAMALVNQLDPRVCALKVGSEMFTLFGTDFVRTLIDQHFRIFLDLKFLDIPTTVARACAAAAELGVWMVNVHATGGKAMMHAAREALKPYSDARPLLIAVTVLTSMSEDDLHDLGVHQSLEQRVCELALLAQGVGLDGVVCSAMDVHAIKKACGDEFLCVTPGIRFSSNIMDDQVRVCTPEQALKAGSDYLVVGRSITGAKSPVQVVQDLLQTMKP